VYLQSYTLLFRCRTVIIRASGKVRTYCTVHVECAPQTPKHLRQLAATTSEAPDQALSSTNTQTPLSHKMDQTQPAPGSLSWRLSSHPITLLTFLGFRICESP
jgi:hypothetical protein